MPKATWELMRSLIPKKAADKAEILAEEKRARDEYLASQIEGRKEDRENLLEVFGFLSLVRRTGVY